MTIISIMDGRLQKFCVACHQQMLVENRTLEPSSNVDICFICADAMSRADFFEDSSSVTTSVQPLPSTDEAFIEICKCDSESPTLHATVSIDCDRNHDTKQTGNQSYHDNVEAKDDVEIVEVLTPNMRINQRFQEANDNGEVIPVLSSQESNDESILTHSSTSVTSVVVVDVETTSQSAETSVDTKTLHFSSEHHSLPIGSTELSTDTDFNSRIETARGYHEEFEEYDHILSRISCHVNASGETVDMITMSGSDEGVVNKTNESQGLLMTPSNDSSKIANSSNSASATCCLVDNNNSSSGDRKRCRDCYKEIPYKCEPWITRCRRCFRTHKRTRERNQKNESSTDRVSMIQRAINAKSLQRQCIVCRQHFIMKTEEYQNRVQNTQVSFNCSFGDYCSSCFEQQTFVVQTPDKRLIAYSSPPLSRIIQNKESGNIDARRNNECNNNNNKRKKLFPE